MMTQSHLIVSAALLTRSGHPRDNAAVIAGALWPDASIFVLFAWSKLIANISERALWSDVYWQEPWQTLSALTNSIPLLALLMVFGLALGWRILWLFAAAALAHIALDFPFHASDAHRHLWPITDWRFHSPLSYWEPGRAAGLVRIFEFAITLAGLVVLWRRFSGRVVRSLLLAGLAGFIAVPLYFSLTLG